MGYIIPVENHCSWYWCTQQRLEGDQEPQPMCPHVAAAASCHGCPDEKPAGEDMSGYVISHVNRKQRATVGLLSGRLGCNPLRHLTETSLPLLYASTTQNLHPILVQELRSCSQVATCFHLRRGLRCPCLSQPEVSVPSLYCFIGIKTAKSILPPKATSASGMLCSSVLCSCG